MLEWEDKALTETDRCKKMCDDIEKCRSEKLTDLNRVEDGVWVKHHKVWEYPYAVLWLEKFRELVCKDSLKVMDFGCGCSPLPQYLSTLGYEVIGLDNHFRCGPIEARLLTAKVMEEEYPGVRYHIDDVCYLDERDFDAIISCSTIEHISPVIRMKTLRNLRKRLNYEGRQMHIVDYYFPWAQVDSNKRLDVYDIMMEMDFEIPDAKLCPGSSSYNFETVSDKVNFLRKEKGEARIAIGDDLEEAI